MNPILECKSLTKIYSGFTALSDVNLTLERGRIIGLLGSNGSGKTTLLKLINGLLLPDSGNIQIAGKTPGIETKKIVSYLPEKTYLADWMKISQVVKFFQDFYENFNPKKAYDMLADLKIDPERQLKTLSKGTKEKVQLILVMSREADLYCLDEPIGGVDPAARDYILNTIINNYRKNSTILISTHLIADIEKVLDEVIFLKEGSIILHSSVDDVRAAENKSIDSLFREVFKC
ncbi:putative ABC transporter ATP-binding protein yhcG [Proteiniborus sp. DW1]|uniref:ABC transporter ATP-binding protein n=1 Tax=Proteiniborus sp. DW1 TaxID=1889883 RepID=UPI00092DEC48|nr:ABC transporter ATP-binding protein [Proteiniborus sp. DW1]SCG82571.1 putative ABC transporter ATP-binding protein yhcG [Proteiniborus sp. DW1]